MSFRLFVSCPKGLEYLLEEELKQLGLEVTQVNPQGVYGNGDLAMTYTLCLWSRLANRVQVILFDGPAHNQQSIHQLCSQFAWENVFSSDKTFAIQFHGSSEQIRNTMFGAQVVKDGIVDHFTGLGESRPSVTKDTPDVRIHARLHHDRLTISLDMTGYSMHQRGYRKEAGQAPLKENLAVAMLIRARWPELADKGYALYDPFCGSGTLAIEAAMIATNTAPGLLRNDQTLHSWKQHQESLWESIRANAQRKIKPLMVSICGADHNANMISIAQTNASRAGMGSNVSFKQASFGDYNPKKSNGLLIFNPPYGERLSDEATLIPLYQKMGSVLHKDYPGWHAAVLTNSQLLAKAIGLRAHKQYNLFNGAINCKLYCILLDENNQLKTSGKASTELSEAAQMFANRLKKNYSHIKKWANREDISCYRVYDADLPEYAFAIDIYNDHVVLQEYAAPATIEEHKAQRRSFDVLQVVPMILNIAAENIIIKKRKPQKGTLQYEKSQEEHKILVVKEGSAKFKVNLTDYIDTGLFLDHRPLRLKFGKLRAETKFLNLFCYTSTVSVHAALAGAHTTNVDLSNTYINWAKENYQLNNINPARHTFVQTDVIEWLKHPHNKYDVIFLDPPSFSNSKRMTNTLDIQRDHEDLIKDCVNILSEDGILYFSNNLKRFKLSPEIMELYLVENITPETIDVDFKRRENIHHCFKIKRKSVN